MATIRQNNPKAFETLNAHIKELDSKIVKVGWFESAKYESGTPVAYVATIQEFGSPKRSIPPRPFMRPTVDEKKQAWFDLAAQGAKAILAGRSTAAKVMEAIGLRAAGDVAKTITTITSPALSPITLQLRAWRREGRVITGATVGEAARAIKQPGYTTPSVSEKPLVDSAILLNTLTSTVEDSSK